MRRITPTHHNHHHQFFRSLVIIVASTTSLFFALCPGVSKATTYYSKSSGNWTTNSTWSTTGYGLAGNTGTYPKAGDNAYIDDGDAIVMNANTINVQNIRIGQNISGVLSFRAGTATTLNVSGNITVRTGAILNIQNGAATLHTLNLTGGFTNNGTVVFTNLSGGNKWVNQVYGGTGNSVITGVGTWVMGVNTLNKANKTDEIEIQSTDFANYLSDPTWGCSSLLLTKGTFHLNCNYNLGYMNNMVYQFVNGAAVVSDLDVLEDVVIKASQGTINLATTGDQVVNLYGSLVCAGGTINVGSGAGVNGLKYYTPSSGAANITVSSGTLNVYGNVVANTGTTPLNFNMSGGVLNTNMGTTVPVGVNLGISNVAGSSFTMSGGTINILRNSSATYSFSLNTGFPANINITGGTISFGNGTTAYTYKFNPSSSIVFPNMKISGAAGTVLKSNSASDFKFLGLYIGSGNTFDFTPSPSNTLTLTGTLDGTNALVNNGTFTHVTGNVSFNGTASQTIDGTSAISFYKLTINNPTTVILNRAVSVTNILYLTSGGLSLNSNTLTLTNASNGAIVRSNPSYILSETNSATNPSIVTWNIGTNTGTYIFPFGVSSTEYIPLTFTKQTAGNSNISVSTRSTASNNTPLATGTNMGSAMGGSANTVIDRWWDISSSLNPLPAPGADISFTYRGTENTLTPSGYRTGVLKVQHFQPGIGWETPLGSGSLGVTAGIGTVSATGLVKFSPYIISASVAPLPIELVEFKAAPNGKKVKLEWSTTSELNNKNFIVEKTSNGTDFQIVSKVSGAGTSSIENKYFVYDYHPYSGSSYYRLSQTDNDGNTKFIRMVPVKVKEGESVVDLYPNPSIRDINLNLTKLLSKPELVQIYDNSGRLLYNNDIVPDTDNLNIDLSGFSAGTYFVRVSVAGEILKAKLVKP